MALEVTTEVVNESDGEVVLKQGNGGLFCILSTLTGRGDRFTIKTDPNATFKQYKLVGTSTATSDRSDFVISSDDCLENERIIISSDPAGILRLDMIKRGMSVTQVVNDTGYDFHVKLGTKVVGVLKARGEYLIQQDPKAKSTPQQYSLVEGENPTRREILISTGDLVDNQILTVSGDNPAVTSKIRRGLYPTEVFNRTNTNLKVMSSEASVEMVTLEGGGSQSFTIVYDPVTKKSCEYWVQTMADPPKRIPIPPQYFVKGRKIEIITDSNCSAGVKLESADPRPVPIPTPKAPNFLSRIVEAFGF